MMNEQLLKIDICSRLPYGVYATSEYSPNGEKVSGIYPEGNGKYFLGDNLKIVHYPIKPILFPVSCLTEEIKFQGEKIIPMVELAKVEGRIDKVTNVYTNVHVLYTVEGIMYNPRLSLVFTFDSDEISFSMEEEDSGCSYSVLDQLKLYDWLNSHMIDYRGLIDKGLAISVLDLKENPYG